MASIKTSTAGPVGAAPRADRSGRTGRVSRATTLPPVSEVSGRFAPETDITPNAEIETAVGAFLAPAAPVRRWLHDPQLAAVLQEASDALSPEDAADRYAAAVIRSHLDTRRELARLSNSLIKT